MRDHPNAVMLFAAGFGTRMGALTKDRPKPLISVAGKPLLDHAIDLTHTVGFARRVVNAHYHADQIAAHLAQSGILLSDESDEILETGGGLRRALPLLGDGPVVTMNTDAVWRGANPVTALLQAWRPADMDALLMCIPRDQAVGHTGKGDFIMDDAGRLTRGAGVVYSGVQIIKTDLLDTISETSFSLNLLWERMLERRRMFGLCYAGQWCDVGTPEGITLAETMLESSDV